MTQGKLEMKTILDALRNADDSDLYLTVGALSLFFGLSLVSPPAAYCITGLLFLYIAHLLAQSSPAPKFPRPPMRAQ